MTPEHTTRQKLRDYLERGQASAKLHLAIQYILRDVLKKYEGKKLTKRSSDAITSAIEAANLFPKPPTYYFKHPGELSIWDHATIPYDQRITFYFCPDTFPSNESYQGSWVQEFHYASLDYTLQTDALETQIADIEYFLRHHSKLDRIVGAIVKIREGWEELDGLSELYQCAIGYEAQRLTGLKRDYSYQEDRS
jgi:hypothetical protein